MRQLISKCTVALFEGLLINILVLVVALVVLDKATDLTIDNAVKVADVTGSGKTTIGFILVAFCTSLPALSVSIFSALTDRMGVAIGNIVGACFINTTLILGASLVVTPLEVDMGAFSSLVMFSVIANLFLWYFLANEKIGWREGVVLLFMYFLFLTISLGGFKP